MALTLYGDAFFASPYVMSVFVTLEEKKLPYALELVALHQQQQQQPSYRARSYTGRVPALDHDGFQVSESAAIVEYLDEVFPAPAHAAALPRDPRDRARARMIMSWVRSDLMPIRDERSTSTVFCGQPVAPLSAAGEAAAARLIDAAERLIPDGASTLFGAWSAADTDLAMMLQRLLHHGHAAPAKVRSYAATIWQRPSVQKWVIHKRPPYVAY